MNKAMFRYGKLNENEMYINVVTDGWSESIKICWSPFYADGTHAPEMTLTGSAFKAVSLFPEILKPFAVPDIQINTVLERFDCMGLGRRHDHYAAR
ncbi:hypothetical protein [Serratia fonticola]|uniref:hypothetical protein n=1 Tax=Serratia fonticola TaxID=47917 RepID=UPI00093C7864|nr:hypothetical protein [Serratia fonticola]OKP21812.1 hypothetical protein BSQ40_25650 [Serratia fonticola]